MTARTVVPESCKSRSSQWAQVAFSGVVGLLSGGAQCTGAMIRSPVNSSPSPEWVAYGWEASPARCRAEYSRRRSGRR